MLLNNLININVTAVGGAVIETSGTVNAMQLSTVNPHKSKKNYLLMKLYTCIFFVDIPSGSLN